MRFRPKPRFTNTDNLILMHKHLILLAIAFATFSLVACQTPKASEPNNLQIAFLADVHLHDIYGQLSDSEYKGIINPTNNRYVLARTMESQLRSTRLFNENYFALLAALDDIAKRGVKYVVLPGDFSDDGQPMNVRGLKNILNEYSLKYGITFLGTTGNHDPVRPFAQEAGKTDFLGTNGQPQAIMSKEGMFKPSGNDALPVVISQDIKKMGYREIIHELADFGFFPNKNHFYWETPFTTYNHDNYTFENAQAQSGIEQRMYELSGVRIPDVSYLVEPLADVWFLAIDANVYIPNEKAVTDTENPSNYGNAGDGYSKVLTDKTHLVEWVKRVTADAKKLGKTLIVFSHYPMVEFTDGASVHIENMMGKGKMQLGREPGPNVSSILADAGITLHFGGHMHINDTGVFTSENGNTLVNVQIPSLAAYIPAYKLLTVKNDSLMEVETVVMDSVPRFNELFPLYELECQYLQSKGSQTIWDKAILSSKTYKEFTMWHLKELVRLRFIPSDWPDEMKEIVLNATGLDLLNVAYNFNTDSLAKAGVNVQEFGNWKGFDFIYDIYRLHCADNLAFNDIGTQRLRQYKTIMEGLAQKGHTTLMGINFGELASVYHKLTNGAPADHFIVNVKTGQVTTIE